MTAAWETPNRGPTEIVRTQMGVVLSCHVCGNLLHSIENRDNWRWRLEVHLEFGLPLPMVRVKNPQAHYGGDMKPLLKLPARPQ